MRYLTIMAAALATASPAAGHHSDAGLDMDSLTTIEGVVSEFGWRNPHIYITLDVVDESGETVEWNIQTGSTITVGRMGWDRDSLAAGDRVTIQTNAARDGRPSPLSMKSSLCSSPQYSSEQRGDRTLMRHQTITVLPR